MARYSAHEHTAKIRNRPTRTSHPELGLLAHTLLPVLAGDTRYYDYAAKGYTAQHRFPTGKRIAIKVFYLPGANGGVPYISINNHAHPTLIECPARGCLRIVFAGTHGGWVEVALTPFHRLLRRARQAYGAVLPDFSTVAVP
jgi:hypothetical protein